MLLFFNSSILQYFFILSYLLYYQRYYYNYTFKSFQFTIQQKQQNSSYPNNNLLQMQPQKTSIQQSRNNLLTLRSQQQLSQSDLSPILKQLQKNRLSYLIFIYANQLMDLIVQSKAKIKFQILALANICSNSSLSDLKPVKITKYKLSEQEKTKQFKQILETEKKKGTNKSKMEQEIFQFFGKVCQAGKNQNAKQVAQAIQCGFKIKGYQMDKQQQLTSYEQFSINYLNFCLEQLRQKLQQKNICCKTIFIEKQHILSGEGPSQQFKRYIWPINNLSIKNHLTKTIVGFMNCKGGIIFIGIMQNKDKKNQVVGIQLKPTDVRPITELFYGQLVGSIFPKHQGFSNTNGGGQNAGPIVRNQFKINDYVKMEFSRVVDKDTFMNIQSKKDGKYQSSLYIVKIVVKIGHPKHLYHIINSQKNIDFFQRKDRNVQKMQFPDAYNTIYERLDNFQIFKQKYNSQEKQQGGKNKHSDSISSLERQLFHPNCRYVMDDIEWILKQDKQGEDDQDDDDDD